MPAAKTASQTKVLIATEHFTFEGEDGRPQFIHAGEHVGSDHPAVEGREALFREKQETD
jgi:hypothetical protein